jgi:hypothetical protein
MSSQPDTTLTPCPFLNRILHELPEQPGVVYENGKVNKVSKTMLIQQAAKFGVNGALMKDLANARLEKGTEYVLIPKLFRTDLAPAHLASLARADGKLEVVDTARLDHLITSPEFSTDGMITLVQLRKYQKYVWSMSKTGIFDRIVSSAEVGFLWSLFGSYQENGKVKLELIDNFLRKNTFPADYKPNTTNPMTVWGLRFLILKQAGPWRRFF